MNGDGMNLDFQRYSDNYGPRVRLISLPFGLKDAAKQHMGWPALAWDGSTGKWSIQDKPDVINKMLAFLAEHNFTVVGLSSDDCAVDEGEATVTYAAPDRLLLKWSFQPNYKDINAAMKKAAQGNAKWVNAHKHWSIPVASAVAVAKAVRPHYALLADAIEDHDEVKKSHEATLQRVELSSAVETSIELPDVEPFKSLRPYQRIAPVMYRTGGRNRILIADEMGLGKSLQALACVEAAEHDRVLIVCPSIVKHNWANEIFKWIGSHYRYQFTSTEIISGYQGEIQPARFHIVNYEIINERADQLASMDYDCIIFDEVHRIKNPKSLTSKAAMRLAKNREGIIALSGTPVTNRPIEFFPALNMMMPGTFANLFSFAQKYCNARKTAFGWDMSGSSNIDDSWDGQTTPLNHILRDFMLRRSMDDPRIAGEMPDLVETIVTFDLTEEQQKDYRNEHNSWMEEWVSQQVNFGSSDAGFTLNMMSQLRHHAGRLKVDAAVKWATEYHERSGKPLVIFAHHKDVIASLFDQLHSEGGVRVINGDTHGTNRQKFIKQFQEGRVRYLICSTNAMREGVNLDYANTTLFVEREWVPAWEQQAAARVRRMTQEESTCHKVVLSANDTIDSLFDQVVAEKADLVERILDGGAGKTREAIGVALLNKLSAGKEALI